MGMFDSYVNEDASLEVQLKNGACLLHIYRVGDTCDLSDAFYYGNEGVVVVRGGKVASVTVVAPENDGLPCFTKWGSQFEPKGTETLADHNPIARGVAAMRAAMSSRDEPERFGQTACSHTGRVLCRSCGAEFDLPTGTTWEDQDDEWTDRIKAAHPSRSGSHEDYATAMRMVGARRSKGALVELVNYLLQR